ncbi:siderophore-interacting protein [Xylanimonas protaetiae]|uniref:Siderophore-interacting protein n=1 Tax=Xylanimonas protaetiae TaxID=2509457 RepID=A0A4V0YG74_9MICO|nr:siderophore-interacting protein [Xylanimonas protaetiae]QAY70221.1 siderophore-interacting protein [Xylanimonas protaetiae]
MGFKDARKERGLYQAEVLRAERVTPHMMRVTVGGDDVARLPQHGFDQWFRLFLPTAGAGTDFEALPEQFGMVGYLKYLAARSGTRPEVRSYTVREHRPAAGELDIDFVVHGEQGVAGPWARRARAGERVALIDQGRGFEPMAGAPRYVLVGDESALPAILGILRDLPRDARGVAIVEIPGDDDVQQADGPDGIEVRWLPRGSSGGRPGALALAALREVVLDQPATVSAYLAGEQSIPAEGRRHLVAAGVPKAQITFVGYWRQGKAQS